MNLKCQKNPEMSKSLFSKTKTNFQLTAKLFQNNKTHNEFVIQVNLL